LEQADELFQVILKQDSSKGYMAYAQAYAKAGLGMEGDALRVQILYILNNLQHWRGKTAREVKKALRSLERELRKS